jgi:hypothetical protein
MNNYDLEKLADLLGINTLMVEAKLTLLSLDGFADFNTMVDAISKSQSIDKNEAIFLTAYCFLNSGNGTY